MNEYLCLSCGSQQPDHKCNPERASGSQQRMVRTRRPTAYDRGQHELICKALKVSIDPNATGYAAYEAVCELLYKQDMALAAKTLSEAKKALRIKPGTMGCIPLYGTGES